MTDKMCLGSGKRPGTGAALARRFARGGYRVEHQDRSAWSMNVQLRPFGEVW